MSKTIDISGRRFGKLIATSIHSRDSKGRKKWFCICDCGSNSVVSSDNLIRNHTTSCGCYRKEIIKEVSVTHGQNRIGKITPEYRAWTHMKTRCYNEKCDMYYAYGGRGIRVCERWLNSFEDFFADMGKRPSNRHSLDRFPNNDGDYEFSNCRWATREQQSRNKSNNNWVFFGQKKFVISDAAKLINTTDRTIRRRVSMGVSPDFNLKQKIVLDLQTGIFYDSAKKAASAKGYQYSIFLHKITGRTTNNTSMIYI